MIRLPIHHIGIASADIHKELSIFKSLGFIKEDEFIDKMQGVKGIFVIPSDRALPQYRFELLENLHEEGPLTNYFSPPPAPRPSQIHTHPPSGHQ